MLRIVDRGIRRRDAGVPRSFLFARQFGQHIEIFQRRRVAFDFHATRNLLEQSPHDFAGARLGQSFRKTYVVRLRDRADFLGDVLAQFFAQFRRPFHAALERDERDERLTFQFIRATDDGGFRNFLITDERALHFRRADAMTRDVQHVVNASDDPEISVLVLTATVAGEITVFDFAPNKLVGNAADRPTNRATCPATVCE